MEKNKRRCLADVAWSRSGLFILFIYLLLFYYLFVFNSHPSVFFLALRTGESLLGEPQHAVQMLSVLMFFFLSPSFFGSFSWDVGRSL